MKIENFFAELKRRNVIRMAGLYLVGAWLLVQVAGTVLPMFGAPEWLPRTIVVLLAIGFVPAVIFSWVFELTPEGLKREDDVAPEQSITPQTGRGMDRTATWRCSHRGRKRAEERRLCARERAANQSGQ